VVERRGRKGDGRATQRRADRKWDELANLLLPALARITGLRGALALVVGDSGARHVGRGAEGGASGRPAIG